MKYIYTTLLVIIILSACNKEDISNKDLKTQSNERFYGVKTPEQTRGVAQIKKLWYPGTTIDIKFLNGSQEFKQKVMTYAAEWEQYANITFDFIEQGDADVRIAFDSNNSRYVTWSTVGTDCKMITNQSEPTMNFVDWDYLYEEEIKGDVLRAFGQVLGLELEHRHIDFNAGWRDNISLYWQGSIEDIPWDELKKYVFDPLESSKVLQTDEYDEESIMIWPFPRQFALNTARDYNFELSRKDIEFIKEVYPKAHKQEPAIILTATELWPMAMIINTTGDLFVDWGNGQSVTISPVDGIASIYPPFTETGLYTIKIYGDEKKITKMQLDSSTESIDISKCTELKVFNGTITQLSTIDFSKNTKLEEIYLVYTNISFLDVSNNIELVKVNWSARDGNYIPANIISFVHSLPDRSGKVRGEYIELSDISDIQEIILPILSGKNWILVQN